LSQDTLNQRVESFRDLVEVDFQLLD